MDWFLRRRVSPCWSPSRPQPLLPPELRGVPEQPPRHEAEERPLTGNVNMLDFNILNKVWQETIESYGGANKQKVEEIITFSEEEMIGVQHLYTNV